MAKQRRYWDAVVFLGWLKAEKDKVDGCRGVIRAAESGKVDIVTSAVTLTEVVHLRKHGPPVRLSSEDEEKICAFFENDYIKIRNADRRTCEFARQLMWEYEHLRYKDAIHAATAVLAEVDCLDTWDPDLKKLDGDFKLPGGISLNIKPPSLPYQKDIEDDLEVEETETAGGND